MKNKENLTTGQLWVKLILYKLFTAEELQLITDINGYNIDTLNNAIYARYGYRDYHQLIEEMEGD